MTTKKNPRDEMVDTLDPVARERWAQSLGVSAERLVRACSMVGKRLTSVRAYLAN